MYLAEVVVYAVNECKKGRSMNSVAKELGCNPSSIKRWIKEKPKFVIEELGEDCY